MRLPDTFMCAQANMDRIAEEKLRQEIAQARLESDTLRSQLADTQRELSDKDALVNDLNDALAAAKAKHSDVLQEYNTLQSLLFPTARCKHAAA
jgi:chromosome segregation ATPase